MKNGEAMKKKLIETSDYLYPKPVVLIGAKVDNAPNFTTVSWIGIASESPPMTSVALRHERYSLKGVRENGVFSVNIPSAQLVEETDYCGIISGAKANKAEACHFSIFYGSSNALPLIEECPVNLECKVVQILNLGSHSLVIGEIKYTYISENCLTAGKPDMNKINPIAYITGNKGEYYTIGTFLGNAYSAGKAIIK